MPQKDPFSLAERVAVVTGGGGALGSAMAQALARAGAKVAVLGRTRESLDAVVDGLRADGLEAMPLVADVLDEAGLARAAAEVTARWSGVDILVNAAGGNVASATVAPDGDLFALSAEGFRQVVDLNLHGSVIPTLVLGAGIAARGHGSIVNVSSMASARAITRVGGYSAAKAAIENFTRWMAVEAARRYGDRLRVNAISPGFFVADQNRHLLLEPDGQPTPRGRTIMEHTPMGRFGEADDLGGAVVWLASDASRFVTGTVVAVDGGFSAFSGV